MGELGASGHLPLGKWLRDEQGVPMREAKTHLSRLAAYANESGEAITVVRNGVPWFEIRPLAAGGLEGRG